MASCAPVVNRRRRVANPPQVSNLPHNLCLAKERRLMGALWLPGIQWEAGAALAPDVPDQRAREAALDTSRSFIVQAPAGSGKTELLIQRFLALLARVAEPESIIAITFTIKAAAEMRGRVIQALENAARGVEPSTAHEHVTFELASAALESDRRLGWALISNPGRLRIQTIDALCAAITRQMPWTSRLGAMPEVIEDAEELYLEAAGRTLDLLEGRDPGIAKAVETLLLHVEGDSRGAENLIARMLAQRDQWLRLLGARSDMALVRQTLEKSLAAAVREGLDQVRDALPPEFVERILPLTRHAARQHDGELDFASVRTWSWLASFLLTDGGEWRKQVNKNHGFLPRTREKAAMEDLLRDLAGFEEFRCALAAVRSLPEPEFDEQQWRVMQAVFDVLRRSVAELNVVFADRGRVDFAEIAIRAGAALGTTESPTDLGLALGSRIEHLLVDEFQDTSELHFDLVRSMISGWEQGDGRTLFLVGDPMQSIYRFRQAEVGLFLKARRDGVEAIRPEPLSLSVNFRSDPGIVDWVNKTFAAVFPDCEDIGLGKVPYSESVSLKEAVYDSPVTLHPILGIEGSVEAEADTALRVIQSARAEQSDGKVTVLVRSRTHLAGLATRLREANIPFSAVEIETLAERPVVQDLLALVRALLHRGDRVSWLAILRAPWCGLTLTDLHAVANLNTDGTIWDNLRNPDLRVSDDAAQRLLRVVPVLAESLALSGRSGLRMLVERTWVSLGGPHCLEYKADLDDALTFLDLLEASDHGGDLPSFEMFNAQVAKLFAQPDPEAGDSLQLMTIHKAKGLEFDTVVIPGLGRPTKQDDPQLLVWVDREGPDGRELLMSPVSPRRKEDSICRYVTRLDRAKTENEAVRLLYVACTRAKRRLHLIGHVRVNAEGEMKPESGSLLAHLWPAVQDDFKSIAGPIATPAPVGRSSAARPIRRVPAEWDVGQALGLRRPPRPPRCTASETQAFSGVEETWRQAGTILHRLLDRIAREGIDLWPPERVQALRPAINRLLPDAASDRIVTGVTRAVTDERGRWVLSEHAAARSEFEIAGVLDGVVYRATIDRTFVDGSGMRWIIDYKASEPAGQDLDSFLDNEQAKYRLQMERYAALFALMENRPVRLALYFPLLGGWREWSPTGNHSVSTRLETSTARTP
jgi:ATP-dependent exoDNAse (exonuclease V) beta subunit